MDYGTPGSSVLSSLPEFAQIHVHSVSDAIQPSHSWSPTSPALNLSSIRVFSSELALHIKWPEYRSYSFSLSPSSEYSQLISFRIDWINLLAVQGTLKSLFQQFLQSLLQLEKCVHPLTFGNSPFPKLVNL